MATVGTYAEELATELGESYLDQDIGAQFRRWVAEVVQNIVLSGDWSFQTAYGALVTVDGARTYELSSTQGDLRAIQKSGSSEALPYMAPDFLLTQGVDLLEEGEPRAFYYDAMSSDGNRVLALWPVPDAEYTYNVFYETAEGANDGESTVVALPADFGPAIRNGVRALYYENSDNDARGATYWSRFGAVLRQLRSRYEGSKQRWRGLQVVDVPPVAVVGMPRLPGTIPSS